MRSTHAILTFALLLSPVAFAAAQTASATVSTTGSASAGSTSQPTQIIHGQVIDEDGQPLPGATIMIKGTRNVCSTNADGVFTLSGFRPAEQVRVSMLGYAEADLAVRTGAANAVTLQLLPGTRIKHGGRHNGKMLAAGRAD
ncbi:carboxypeptidase-like regulatory domain-containing protein [Hymenobacter sp. 15J16-1T3B]|uniref:carboxypeptidase-like regulatory domain-containing protein n=1 Tax=Hymenobacter sp. 15J16-1T3B TaxID=2886941 RepID=UPI001D1276CA|nr:carboxypeptidase-like regulatory domain-containing protein [Hymenobacter sp. 15J16-1T3B]MCC3156301.1 carboxypeptidase-like regulatory domain-containing protein [Hymenobacter sp. 15J16-1T3B]